MCDISAGFDPSDLDQTISCLCHRLADDVCRFCFTLSTDDVRLSLLFCLFDDESCSFGILLGNLLLLDSSCEFATEGHMGDGNVFKRNVELLGAASQICLNALRNRFSLSDEFSGIELSYDGFEDFVTD